MAKYAVSAAAALVVVLSLVSAVSARPCKTIFYFSSITTTSTGFYPYNSFHRNPNSGFQIRGHGPRYLTFIFSSATGRFPDPSSFSSDLDDVSRLSIEKPSNLPLQFPHPISSSIRDRSRDIMSVVGALLFGVGCGGLTAAVMYYLWAICSPGRLHYEDVSSSSTDDDDDDVADIKKKLGYIMIPSQPATIDDDLKKPAPLA